VKSSYLLPGVAAVEVLVSLEQEATPVVVAAAAVVADKKHI
jgi:hypothetical protein